MINRLILILLYLATLSATVYLIVTVGNYYTASPLERPLNELHPLWKPGGVYGHGLGVLGSALMLILLLYTLRKNSKFMRNWGSLQTWLNYHIWMGITGPILVTFHTSFKFGGIVAISFWSMAAVALSGFLGRYLYVQIPRTKTGKALSASELQEQDLQYTRRLQEMGLQEDQIARCMSLSGGEAAGQKRGFAGILFLLAQDITLPFKLRTFRREIAASAKIETANLKTIMKILRSRAVFLRRLSFLKTSHQLLHYWHIVHRPFALVMLLIMVIHVIVTIIFGYHWIL